MTFFAVQVLPNEHAKDVAHVVLTTSVKQGATCKELTIVDQMEIGSRKFVRFQSDLAPLDTVLNAVLAEGRAVIYVTTSGYTMWRAEGKKASVPYMTMQVAGRGNPIRMRGNSLTHWDRQFLKGTSP